MKANRSNTLLYLVILTLFTVFFFGEMIFLDKIPFYRDTLLQFYPWQDFQTSAIKAGHLPLWNNLSGCGSPFIANLQSAVFYPFKLFFLMFPFALATKLFILANILTAAFSMFFLSKDFKLGDRAALLSALIFTFSGYMITRIEFWSVMSASVVLPLIFLMFKRLLDRGTIFYFTFSALALSLPIFAGSAQMFFFSLLLLLPFSIWYSVRERKVWWKGAGALCFVSLTALLISAIQLFPFLEFVQNSVRQSGLAYSEVSNWSLHPYKLLNFLAPFTWGDPKYSAYFGSDQFWISSIYCGVASVFLSLLACFIINKNRFLKSKEKSTVIYFGVIFAIFLLLAFGKFGGLHKLFYYIMPLFRMIRYPAVIIILPLFSLSLLSGFVFERLYGLIIKKGGVKTVFLVVAVLLAILVAAYMRLSLFSSNMDGGRLQVAGESFLFSAAMLLAVLMLCHLAAKKKVKEATFTAVFVLLVSLDLAVNTSGMIPFTTKDEVFSLPATAGFMQADDTDFRVLTEKKTMKMFNKYYQDPSVHKKGYPYEGYLREIKPILHDNYNMLAGLECANVYDPMRLAKQDRLFLAFDKQEKLRDSRIVDITNTKYLVSVFMLEEPGLKLKAKLNGLYLYENTSVMPRAFVVYSTKNVFTPKEAYDLTVAGNFKPEYTAVVEGSLFSLKNGERRYTAAGPLYQYADRVLINFNAQASGLLVLSDSFYPGWEAALDGVKTKVYRVNYMFRGVYVPAGEHTVEMVYRPLVFRAGTAVTLLSLAFLLLGTIWLSEKKTYLS